MPVTRPYTGGSIVYFEGDKGDDVYVLKQGRVVLISTALDTGEEVREEVQIGEFFGAKSSLGRYPREETAQVIGKTTLIVFSLNEFEQFIMKNTRLILKMLRVFSKNLRDIHRQVRDILKADTAKDQAYELLNVAEAFFKSGNIDHAVYAFEKYLEYYPDGVYASRAGDLLQKARQGKMYPMDYPPLAVVQQEILDSETVKSGMMPVESLDDPFSMPEDDSFGEEPAWPADLLSDGMTAFSAGKFDDALSLFDQVASMSSNDIEQEAAIGQAKYEKGRTLVKLKRFEEATGELSAYIKAYPTGEFVKKAIFQLGTIAEASGNKDRARSLYHKTATMPPPDEVSKEAKNRLEKLG